VNCIKQFFLLLDITSNKNKGKQKEKKNDLVFLIFYHSYVFPEKKTNGIDVVDITFGAVQCPQMCYFCHTHISHGKCFYDE